MTALQGQVVATLDHAIRFRNVSNMFGGIAALSNVDFEVSPGEVHCLAGENGSGKSTLIKVITGVYVPEPGAEMSYFGHAETAVSPTSARHHGIAVIWQDLAPFAEMTVAENIAFETLLGNRPRMVNHGAMRKAATAALARLGVAFDLDARLGTLPIAQRQIVAIARALVSDARLIFMDEPTASLTQSETDALLGVVRTLSSRGVAVVFVSHRLAEVLEISSRVTVLRDGKLVGVYPTEGMTQSGLTELMTGKTIDHDLAGRTELGHTLFGMTRPASGTILLKGRPLRLRSNRDAVAAGIAYVSAGRIVGEYDPRRTALSDLEAAVYA